MIKNKVRFTIASIVSLVIAFAFAIPSFASVDSSFYGEIFLIVTRAELAGTLLVGIALGATLLFLVSGLREMFNVRKEGEKVIEEVIE